MSLSSSYASIFALVVAAMPAFSTAKAAEAPLWKKVNGWEVRVDSSLNYGCFLINSFSKGTVLRIGFDQKNLGGYIFVNNASWRSLETGKEYILTMQFDEESPWRGPAIATGKMGLLVKFAKANFLVEFARKQTLNLWYEGKLVTRLPLTGTKEATDEMVNCQRQIDAAKDSPTDPFAQSGRDDPFRPTARNGPTQLDPFKR